MSLRKRHEVQTVLSAQGGETARLTAMNTDDRSIDILFRILSSQQEQIRFADSKATFVAALNALLFGFMATHFVSLKALYTAYGMQSFAFWGPFVLLALYVVSSMSSLLLAVWGVMPRFGGHAPRSKIYFEHLVRDYGKDYEKYVQEVTKMTEAEWVRDLGTQVVEVSHITLTKHTCVRRAATLLPITALLWALSFVVLLMMTP